MNTDIVSKFFVFLEEKKQQKIPLNVKLLSNIKLSKEDLICSDLLLYNQKNIKKLPDNLTVTGRLDLAYSGLQKLPKNLKAKYLHISYTKITEIPQDLEASFIFAMNSELKKLPDNLTLINLNLQGSQIIELPDNLTVEYYINLTDAKYFNTIPKNLTTNRLVLYGSELGEKYKNKKKLLIKKLEKNNCKIEEVAL